jgi:hypothetical protein
LRGPEARRTPRILQAIKDKAAREADTKANREALDASSITFTVSFGLRCLRWMMLVLGAHLVPS